MKWIDKLERKFGNRWIDESDDLYYCMLCDWVYALMYMNPGALSMLSLDVQDSAWSDMETCYMDDLSAEYGHLLYGL